MVVKDPRPSSSHRACRRCHYCRVVWKSFSTLQGLLRDFLGTNEDRTDPFLPHAHPIRSDKFSQWSQFKESRVMKFESSEWCRDKTSGVRALASCLPMLSGDQLRWSVIALLDNIDSERLHWTRLHNYKLETILYFLSDALHINHNVNNKKRRHSNTCFIQSNLKESYAFVN